MPGTGHSHRYKSSISNRNAKPAFQVLAPWNKGKLGKPGQVPTISEGGNLQFSSHLNLDSVTLSANSVHFDSSGGPTHSLGIDNSGCLAHTVKNDQGMVVDDHPLCFNHGIKVKGPTSISGPLSIENQSWPPSITPVSFESGLNCTRNGNDTAGLINIVTTTTSTIYQQQGTAVTVKYNVPYDYIPSLIWSISVTEPGTGFDNLDKQVLEYFQSLFYVKNQTVDGFQFGLGGSGLDGESSTAPSDLPAGLSCIFNYLVIKRTI